MALELIELGSLEGEDDEVRSLPPAYRHLEDFVQTFEDPLAKVRLPCGVNPKVVEKCRAIRSVSGKIRKRLVHGSSPVSISGLGDIFSDIGGALSGVFDKVSSVLNTPGFMTSLASAASFIPKIGPQVGAALASFAKTNPSAVTTAAASSAAASSALGLPGNILDFLPDSLRRTASSVVPGLIPQAKAGGDDLLAALLKSIGNFVAIQTVAKGAGMADGLQGLGQIADLIRSHGDSKVQSAIKAGEEDLRNAAALGGGGEAIDLALERGSSSEFPWLAVGVAATLAVVTTVVLLR